MIYINNLRMKMVKCNCGGMEGDHADDCPIKNK